MPEVVEFKIPKTLPKTEAACADLLYQARAARLLVQKNVDAIAALESELKAHLIAAAAAKKATGFRGKLALFTCEKVEQPVVSNWDKLWPWIVKNKVYAAVQKRINTECISEHLLAGEKVPGIDKIFVDKVSVTKV